MEHFSIEQLQSIAIAKARIRIANKKEQNKELAITAEMKPVTGFIDTLRNPIDLIKEESLPANLIKWFSTSEEEYQEKELQDKRSTLENIPILSSMNERLDTLDELEVSGQMTARESTEKDLLIQSYGNVYEKMESAYDKGDLEQGFSVGALAEAFKEDPGGMLGEVANGLMTDPYLMAVGVGWTRAAENVTKAAVKAGMSAKGAKVAGAVGGVTSTSALGASMAVAINGAEQLANEGKIKVEEIETAAQIGAVAAPLLVGGFKAAGKGLTKVGEYRLPSKVDKTIKALQERAVKYAAMGMTDEFSISKAINEIYIPTKVRKELNKRKDWINDINITRKAVEARQDKLISEVGTLKGIFKEGLENIKISVKDYIASTATELGVIHPSIGHALRRMDQELALDQHEALKIKEKLQGLFKSLSKDDGDNLELALVNSRTESAKALAMGSSEGLDALNSVRLYLDDMLLRAKAVGIDMNKREGYFPREIVNYNRFAASRGYTKSNISKALAQEINKKFKLKTEEAKVSSTIKINKAREYLTDDEISDVLNRVLTPKEIMVVGTPKYAKARIIETLTKEDLKHYRHPVETLTNYINTMESRIAMRKFFGKGESKPDEAGKADVLGDSIFLELSIGRLAGDLFKKGEMLENDIPRMEELLKSRFIDGIKTPLKIISGTKNILYATLLGNPFSAATQLGDLGASVYLNGTAEAAVAVAKVLTRTNKVKLEELGLMNIMQELEYLGPTAKFLHQSLKFGGFQAVDRLGKEVILESSLNKASKLAKTKVGRKELFDKFKYAYTPNQFRQLTKDLANKTLSPDVKYLLWHEVARVQPISLSEMPLKYLQNPNGRIFYMLKTFALKQLDLMRRDGYNRIKSGDVQGGMLALVRYSSILGLANGSVDFAKKSISGKDVEFTDTLFVNIMRLYMLQQYSMDKMSQGDVVGAVGSVVLPPVGLINDITQDVLNLEINKTLDDVPVFGKGLKVLFEEEE